MGNTVHFIEICMLYILEVEQVIAIQSWNVCLSHPDWTTCSKSVQLHFEHQLLPTLRRAAAVEGFHSFQCIPADCLCLVCCHAACPICAIICELLLWFLLDPVRHFHTSCNVSATINQVNIFVLQLLQLWFWHWFHFRLNGMLTRMAFAYTLPFETKRYVCEFYSINAAL